MKGWVQIEGVVHSRLKGIEWITQWGLLYVDDDGNIFARDGEKTPPRHDLLKHAGILDSTPPDEVKEDKTDQVAYEQEVKSVIEDMVKAGGDFLNKGGYVVVAILNEELAKRNLPPVSGDERTRIQDVLTDELNDHDNKDE